MEEGPVDIDRLALPQAALDMNMDDISFRLRVREMLRARQAAASFCDDEWHNNPMEPPTLPSHVLTGIRNSNLIASAHCASTEDHPDQRAEMTVQNDGNFWSSTGSPHEIGEEFILYKLKHPLSVVRAVVVQVYRATFQGGGPIYPAKQILVDVGHSPSTMRTVGGPYTMACTDAEQTFLIPPSHQGAATGSYVGIRFLGKYQKQLFDEQYYLSMQHVRVLGTTCAAADITALRSLAVLPNPPRSILPPACIPQPLTAALEKVIGSNHAAPTSTTGHADEYTVKIELPGWAQKDFMHFVEQLAASGGPQAPSDQLLPSLCLQPGSATAEHLHACAQDWMQNLKSSSYPSAMLSMAHGFRGGAAGLSHRQEGAAGAHHAPGDQHAVLDEADTTADGSTAQDIAGTLRACAQQDVIASQAAGAVQPRPMPQDVHMREASVSMHAGVQMGSVMDTSSPCCVRDCRMQGSGDMGSGAQDSMTNASRRQGAQATGDTAELDTTPSAPGLLFGTSGPVQAAMQSSAYGTLPPIVPLGSPMAWGARSGWVPPWPCMHAHEACDGPVHASVCENGGLRCVVWERQGRRSLERRCEGVEESEMAGARNEHGASSSQSAGAGQGHHCGTATTKSARGDSCAVPVWHQTSLKTAPAALMWCRDPSSSAVGGVRLQGVRKHPSSCSSCAADIHEALGQKRWPAADTSCERPCSRGDIQRMLFGPVHAGLFTVPMG